MVPPGVVSGGPEVDGRRDSHYYRTLQKLIGEIQAEQVEKNAALLIERHVEGSKCTAAPT